MLREHIAWHLGAEKEMLDKVEEEERKKEEEEVRGEEAATAGAGLGAAAVLACISAAVSHWRAAAHHAFVSPGQTYT
jgi:hypothetical protein